MCSMFVSGSTVADSGTVKTVQGLSDKVFQVEQSIVLFITQTTVGLRSCTPPCWAATPSVFC